MNYRTCSLVAILILALTSLPFMTDAQTTDSRPTIRFAILGDLTGNGDPAIYQQAVDEIARLRPDFVMTVGDMIEGYTSDTATLRQEWDDYLKLLEPLDCPMHFTPGNHDITFDEMEPTYREWIGKPYYSFDYQYLHLIVLDNSRQEYGDGLPAAELEWLSNDLAQTARQQVTLAFMHKPFWYNGVAMNETDPIHTLFTHAGVKAVFTGHFHTYFSGTFDNIQYTGVGSSGAETDQDSFDMQYHFIWVTVDSDGVHVAPIRLNSVPTWDVQTVVEAQAKSVLRNNCLSLTKPLMLNESQVGTELPFTVAVKDVLPGLDLDGHLVWSGTENWRITPTEQLLQVPSGSNIALNFTAACLGELYPLPYATTILPYAEGKTAPITLSLEIARQIEAHATASPPTLDGIANESSWFDPITQLYAPDGTPSACDSTYVYFAYDDQNLYLAAICKDGEIDKLAANYTNRDDPVYGEDCFGIMIQPVSDSSPGYQIYVNPKGAIYDQQLMAGADGYWTSDNTVDLNCDAKAQIGDKFWSVEMRLPLEQFGAKIESGDSWRMTFRRKQARLSDAAALQVPWSYNPHSYGLIVFE